MRLSCFASLVLGILLLATAGHAEEESPTIGLVLAGGGARGAAHVGVLKVLEELRIRPDYIAGTSMGAVVGGLYAAGISAEDIEAQLNEIDWDRVFRDDIGRPGHTMRRKQLDRDFLVKRRLGFNRGGLQVPLGVLQGQHFDQALKRILGTVVTVDDFDQLPIPFRAVATDITTGEAVVMSSGSLAQAIRASMSVPAIFAPVERDGRLLVDGGLAMNVPVEVAQAMGADRLIVVDLSAPLLDRDEIDSIFRITEQMTTFLTRRNTEHSLSLMGERDILLVPPLDDIGSVQFDRVGEAMAIGEASARDQLKPLRQLAGTVPSRTPPAPIKDDPPKIGFIQLDNQSPLHDSILWSRIRLRPGEALDLDRLESDLEALYALDVFDVVRYDLVEDPERGTGVLVTAQERHWGPNYLQLGMALTSDFDSVNDFSLGGAYTRNAVNRLGGDLRVVGNIGRRAGLAFDMYQPLDSRAKWFVQPVVSWSRDRQDVFDGEFNLGTVQLQNRGASLGGGRNFGNTFQLRSDFEWSQDRLEVIRGAPAGLHQRETIGEWRVSALYDTLNNVNFPNSGAQSELTWRRSLSALGADQSWEQVQFTGVSAFTRGRWSYLARGFTGMSFERDLPFSRQYRLGGFGRLSGLPPDALAGEQAALGSLTFYRRIGSTRFFPVFAGMALEAGNVWERRADMAFGDLEYAGAAFIGVDTVLGPMYLAYGRAEGGRDSFYFYLGNPFELRR